MKFIHCADLHFGITRHGHINPLTGINTRIEEDFVQFDKIINYAIKKRVELFLIAGDVFDKRKPDEIVQREFAKRLKTLIKNKIKTVVLIGNHDGVSTKATAHCLSAIQVLARKKYLYIVDKSKVIELDNILIACLPYYDSKTYTGFLLKKGMDAILLAHATVIGTKLNGYVLKDKKGLSPLLFNNKQFIYNGLGHIHEHQIVENAVYSGSINRINFGDEGIKKGFILGNIINHKCTWKFIVLNSRKYLTINTHWSKGLKKRLDEYIIKDKIVKLNLKDTEKSYIPIEKIKQYFIKNGALIDSVNIQRDVKIKVRDITYKKKISPIDALKHYLKKENKSVINRGIEILKEIAL